MLGSLLMLIGVALLVMTAIGTVVRVMAGPESPVLRQTLTFRRLITAGTVAVVLMATNPLIFYAEPGYSYLVQYPWGTQVSVMTPGYKFRMFGNTIPYKKVLTVKYTLDENDAGMYTAVRPAVDVRFNDAVMADVWAAVRFRLPEDAELFRRMAVDTRSQENLANSVLAPFGDEVTRNAARLISAQEYVVGRGGEFENAALDQLRQGIYILDTEIIQTDDTPERITQAGDREIQREEMAKYKVEKRLDSQGNPVRKDHPFIHYGIQVVQATVENVDFEPEFKDLLKQQRDAAAQSNIMRQQAQRAEFEKQKIIAEGEAAKASTRVDLERKQITQVIAAETKKKEEELLLEAARLEAKRIREIAGAEADRRARLMAADNALDKRLEAMVEIQKVWATSVGAGKIPLVPQVVAGGNGQGSSSALDLINLLTAKAAKDIGLEIEQSRPLSARGGG